MNLFKKISSVILLAAIIITTVCTSTNTLSARADDGNTLNVTPAGVSYKGSVHNENKTIDVSSGTEVVIGYYAMNNGWMIFGLPELYGSGEGVNKRYQCRLDGNYKCVIDIASHVVYFQKTYVGGGHTHSLVWGQVTMPTYYRPTVDTYFCTECYHIESTRPASAASYDSIYGNKPASVTTISAALANVAAGSEVTINLGKINNVSAADMNLIKNSNATVTLNFVNNGKNYTITIPAGGCLTHPSIEFYGPELLRNAYNGTVK